MSHVLRPHVHVMRAVHTGLHTVSRHLKVKPRRKHVVTSAFDLDHRPLLQGHFDPVGLQEDVPRFRADFQVFDTNADLQVSSWILVHAYSVNVDRNSPVIVIHILSSLSQVCIHRDQSGSIALRRVQHIQGEIECKIVKHRFLRQVQIRAGHSVSQRARGEVHVVRRHERAAVVINAHLGCGALLVHLDVVEEHAGLAAPGAYCRGHAGPLADHAQGLVQGHLQGNPFPHE